MDGIILYREVRSATVTYSLDLRTVVVIVLLCDILRGIFTAPLFSEILYSYTTFKL